MLAAFQQGFGVVLRALVEACREVYGDRLRSLAVFGSVARGTARPDSDVDLLLVASDLPRGRMARNREFERVERLIAPALAVAERGGVTTRPSVVFRTPEEAAVTTPILLDLVEDARLLVDDGTLARKLAELRSRLAETGARRVWVGTRWYWDLKPDFRPGDVVEL